MKVQRIPLDGSAVPYTYGTGCPDGIADAVLAADEPDRVILVLDRRAQMHAGPIADRLARSVPVRTYVVDAAEPNKALSLVEQLLEYAIRQGATRRSTVVAMGGGLVGNVAGLAAALLYRGIRLVHLPTTPVAAFDAVLSVKQGVNLSGGKNLCGTYFRPALIACDFAWFRTIPRHEMLTGVAEMAKNVLAVVPHRRALFEQAVADLPDRPHEAYPALAEIGITAKLPLLDRDPRERHDALVFEYGHTVGHALEFLAAGELAHGEAVAWGMLVAAEVARRRHGLPEDDLRQHYRLVSLLRLPPPRERLGPVDRAALRTLLAADNKRGYLPGAPGEIPMVLLGALGRPLTTTGLPLVAVPDDEVLAAFDRVARSAGRPLAMV